MVLRAAVAVASLIAAYPALAATYSSDKAYTFPVQPSQSGTAAGRGIAVNTANTRLYEIVNNNATGSIQFVDTTSGSAVGSITPPTPTTMYDVVVTPDDSKVLFSRYVDASTCEIDAAPATDGDHTSSEVTTVISGIPNSSPTAVALSIAQSGGTTYLGILTSSTLSIYSSASAGSWTKVTDVPVSGSTVRDVAAADTGSGIAFFVLLSSYGQTPNVLAYNLDGTQRAVTFGAIPSAFTGYTWEAITNGGAVDGTPSLFLAADTTDINGDPALTEFRFSTAGAYQNDGFGYALSGSAPLNQLQPPSTNLPLTAQGYLVGTDFYVSAALPDSLGDPTNPVNQIVRVAISGSTQQPGKVSGTVQAGEPPAPVAGAQAVLQGRDAAQISPDGTYSFTNITPGPTTIGASAYGYIAASTTVNVGSGEDKTGVNLTLPGVVPKYQIAHAFAPAVTNGTVEQGEYAQDTAHTMSFFGLGGGLPEASLGTVAYMSYGNDAYYIAVVAQEPSIGLNRAYNANENLLTQDDNIQFFFDPPHRHDVPGTTPNLYQFAVSVPGYINGIPTSSSVKFARHITSTGASVGAIPIDSWQAYVTAGATSFTVEARIPYSVFQPFNPPTAGTVWGMLLARHRSPGHNDGLPSDFSTSPVQTGSFYTPNTWTDISFAAPITNVAGDVNENGVVDVNDVVLTMKMAAGLSYGTAPSDVPDPNAGIRDAVLNKADVWPAGGDGKITLQDAVRLARAASGLSPLP